MNHLRRTSLCLRPETNSQRVFFSLLKEENLSAASFKAVGALSSVRLGWFSWESKRYEPSVTLDEQVELLSLIGDVALKDGEPVVHAHAVIGKKDGTAHGGHLLKASIRPTCEVVLTESPTHLQKFIDPDSGLALIDAEPFRKAAGKP